MNKAQQLVRILAIGAIALGQADLGQAADANPPERMTYQGYLVDGNGDPLGNSAPANYDVVFRVYREKSGAQDAIWAEQQTVTVDKGYFSVLLGEGSSYLNEPHGSTGTNLSSVMRGADISDRYIGITVGGLGGGDVEIAPRLRLVTSPFAFTASQAMKLTDNAGNSNFFKDGTSLKLGAGSTPTLTLAEDGDATLDGQFTVNLTGNGTGLQISNGSSKATKLKGADTGSFQFLTGYDRFFFDKNLRVGGLVESFDQDLVLRPSNNTDTYLKISKGSDDKISAYSNAFRVEDEANDSYLEINPNSSGVQFNTGSGTFQMTKPLEVTGNLSATGALSSGGNITITKPGAEEAVLSLRGSDGSQGTGRLFVGQSPTYGGGIIYNGDGSPAFAGGSTDHVSFYRTYNSVHHEVFKYKYNSDDVTFNGTIKAKAYDMTVLTYEHPQTTPISDWGNALLLEGIPYQKVNLDFASDTLAGMDRKFTINNPEGAICDFKFIWSTSGNAFIIVHLLVTTDADGSNNQIKLLAKAIQGGPYPSISLNQSVKLSQGTHRVVVKYRNGSGMNLTPAYDYGMLKLQVKVNGDADAVGSGWVTEKL